MARRGMRDSSGRAAGCSLHCRLSTWGREGVPVHEDGILEPNGYGAMKSTVCTRHWAGSKGGTWGGGHGLAVRSHRAGAIEGCRQRRTYCSKPSMP